MPIRKMSSGVCFTLPGVPCDIEKGRKTASAKRDAKWARVLGYPESVFVRAAIQDELDAADLKYRVEINAA